MQSTPKPNKQTILLFLAALGLIISMGALVLLWTRSNTARIDTSLCKSNQYLQLHVGMTKPQVIELWGEPSTRRVKDGADQNFFYQGATEAMIKEGWMYRNGHPDSVEVYFDSAGLVNGKNCGQA